MSRLEEIAALVSHVAPFPKVAVRILTMLDDPTVTARHLAEVIQFDQAIMVNLLKVCNSACFGLPRQVTSVEDALVLLGQDALKEIIITGSSAGFYSGRAGAGYQLEEGELWRHSVATALMARMLARYLDDVDSGSAFTCGLLHDIGKRFLGSLVAEEFQEIMERVGREECSFVQVEREVLGTDHAELGSMIFEKWGFAPGMVAAVRDHHRPDALQLESLTALTALSNSLVITMGIGVGADGLASEMQGAGLDRFGVSMDQLQVHMADLLTELEKARELIELNMPGND